MSYPVTEIAYIPINTNNYDLESGEGKQVWDATLKTISEQKGFKRLSWGFQIENPSVAQMAIDWDSLDAHNTFIASDPYGPFLERLRPLIDGAPQLFHIKLPTSPSPSPFDAPVTECISLYFQPSIEESVYEKSFANFVAAAEKVQGSGAEGIVGGWGVEKHRFEGEGEEMRLFGGFVGWPSVETHMRFREMEEFPAVVAHLREGVEKIKVHHVAFKRFEA